MATDEGGATSDAPKNMPKATFRAGGVKATVWENPGRPDLPPMLNANITRTYKDKDGEFKESTSFQQNDLPKVILVAQKAYELITLKADGNGKE